MPLSKYLSGIVPEMVTPINANPSNDVFELMRGGKVPLIPPPVPINVDAVARARNLRAGIDPIDPGRVPLMSGSVGLDPPNAP